ncbi:MAG TPA: hypothetical protein VKA67_06470 [Verrucomicrobiae bacterium]|nr:hypothetical protein [Verrucomicrobiae bacterium]
MVEKVEKSFSVGVAAGHGARSVSIIAQNGDFGRVGFYRDYYTGEHQEGFGSMEAAREFFSAAQNGRKMTREEVLAVLRPGTEEDWAEAIAAS